MKNCFSTALCAVALIGASYTGSASAHTSLETTTAATDSTYKAVLRVGHGCEGQPTHTVKILVPPQLRRAKPMPKAGWSLEVVKEKLDEPFDYYGQSITEDVREIIWSAGNLPDDFYDEFVFRAKVAGEPGQTLYLKTIQECAQGEHRWIEIPKAGQDRHELEQPAPALEVTDKHAGH